MKKITLSILSFALVFQFSASAQNGKWNKIYSDVPSKPEVMVSSVSLNESTIDIHVNGFYLNHHSVNGADYVSVELPQGVKSLDRGMPDMDIIPVTLAIPNDASMEISIVASDYVEYKDMLIAPSKGNIYRNVNPDEVPYKFNSAYSLNEFLPNQQVIMRDPFVVRDFRGQSFVVKPFQYNPVSHVLRVYSHLTIEVKSDRNRAPINPLSSAKSTINVDPDFAAVYQSLFKNYPALQYTPVSDQGKMLVVCADQFLAQIQPLVDWKIKKGIGVTVIPASQFGGNPAAIKDQITALYFDQGLKYVLLVGDINQIPSFSAWTGASDPTYGYLVGNDSYAEVFVGRISAESTADVVTQVDRILHYERNVTAADTWLSKGVVIGSNQGPGDDNEMDWEHERNIRTDLLGAGYTTVDELYDGTHAGTTDAAGDPAAGDLINSLQSGASIISYTGHGSTNSFGTTGFSNWDIGSLNNQNKLPFIWAVACVNGEFNSTSGPCLAEGLLRAQNSNMPIGAVGTFMSSINQSWNPPMDAQDEMVDLLVQAGNANAIRSLGALSVNGCMLMNDDYGSAGVEMTDTWHVFGDPSLEVRTSAPQTLTVTHTGNLVIGTTSLSVSVNMNGAFVSLTSGGSIISTGTVTSNIANLTFDALTTVDTLFVTVTGFNMIPYEGYIIVTPASGSYVTVNGHSLNDPSGNNNQLADYNESLQLDLSLINYGSVSSGAVDVTIASADPYITITDSTANVALVGASAITNLSGEFAFTVANNIPDQHVVYFVVTCVDAGGVTTVSTISIVVNAPVIKLSNAGFSEGSLSDGDGVIESGEEVNYSITVSNIGHADAINLNYYISSSSANITLNSGSGNIASLNVGQSAQLSCTFVIAPNLSPGTTYDLNNVAIAGAYADSSLIVQSVGEILETFESGDFTYMPWVLGGTKPWIVSNDLPFAGSYCAKSDDINDLETSELKIDFNSAINDSLSFYYMISSELSYDFFRLYVDGVNVFEESGIRTWNYHAQAIAAGSHEIKFNYEKDVTVSEGSDCSWIDNVRLPVGATITGISHSVIGNSNNIYPNPASDYITIVGGKNGGINTIELYTLEGKLLNITNVNGLTKTQVNVSNLSTGMYIVQVKGKDYRYANKISVIR